MGLDDRERRQVRVVAYGIVVGQLLVGCIALAAWGAWGFVNYVAGP